MLKFVWNNRDELIKNWRDSSLKKSIEKAFSKTKNADEARENWLNSDKCFRSYAATWENTGPSLAMSRSWDSYDSSNNPVKGGNCIHIWLREKDDVGKGFWTYLGGKEKGKDEEGDAPWSGVTYIRRGSVVMCRIRLVFFCSSVGWGVSIRFSEDLCVLAQSEGASSYADPDL
jgi:hypothetical protein